MKRSTFTTLFLGLGLATPAFATPNFLAETKDYLALPTVPSCTLCHSSNAGGAGTVTTAFGKALLAEGAIANDTSKLRTAFDAIVAKSIDVNGNGVDDVQDLKNGVDPNVPVGGGSDGGVTPVPPPTLRYGCGASVVQSPADLTGAGALGCLLWRARRRRRR
jgi:hypothetical protein